MVIKEFGKYTREEIISQPVIWESVLESWSESDIQDFPSLSDYDQVIFIGCGSTFFLSRWAARMAELHTGVISRAIPSSDLLLFSDYWLQHKKKTLLIASSRSGATTETIQAVEFFQSNYNGDVIAITCDQNEQVAAQTESVLSAELAQEQSIAQTRSFSSMMLAHALNIHREHPKSVGKILRNAGEKLFEDYEQKIYQLAGETKLEKFFFLGSGPLYGLANECMLKMKEISLSYAESFHSLEFRHGPMSMVDDRSLVVGLLGDRNIGKELSVLGDMKAIGARTLAITESIPQKPDQVDDLIHFQSSLPVTWRSVLYLPMMQLLAYQRGMNNGLDPDRPNNLEAVVVLDG